MNKSVMDAHRRTNLAMAEKVQQGISLLLIAGPAEARRYLVRCGAPPHVIERVLSGQPGKRRMFGSHGYGSRRKGAAGDEQA